MRIFKKGEIVPPHWYSVEPKGPEYSWNSLCMKFGQDMRMSINEDGVIFLDGDILNEGLIVINDAKDACVDFKVKSKWRVNGKLLIETGYIEWQDSCND